MDITPATDHLSFTISAAGGAVACLTFAVWRAANFARDIRDELKMMREDIKEAWTRREQERFAANLERKNRALNLRVPGVSDDSDDDTVSPT